ncbi:unnamed protein product, partial [marine sediment metagenome]
VMEGVISGTQYAEPFTAQQQALKERYLAKYGPPFVADTIGQSTSWEMLFEAIELAGTWETQALVNTLRTTEFDTISGKAHYGGKEFYGIDNAPLYPLWIGTAKGGKIVHLDAIETGANYPPPSVLQD